MRWGAALALASALLFARDLVNHTAKGLTDASGEPLAGDFLNIWSGARLALRGTAALVYDHPAFGAFEQGVVGPAASPGIYSYPPVALLLSLPLGLLPFVAALILWIIAGSAICCALLQRLVGWRAAAIAIVGAPAAFLNLLSAQNGCFTASLLAGGLMILDRRPVLSGICFGCLVYKPQMAVLLPFALGAGRRWRTFIATGVTALLLVALSFALLGTDTWIGFRGQLATQRELLEFNQTYWPRMPTVFAALRMLGVPPAAAHPAQLVSGLAAIAAVIFVWWRPAPTMVKAAALVVATFVATPYGWDYDAVVLLFAAAWLGRTGLGSGFLPGERLAIATLLGLPLMTLVLAALARLPIGPVALWLVLWLLLRRAARRGPRQAAGAPS